MIDKQMVVRMLNAYGTQTLDETQQARIIAEQTMQLYGNDAHEIQQIFEKGIPGDHPVFQAALVAIRITKGEAR